MNATYFFCGLWMYFVALIGGLALIGGVVRAEPDKKMTAKRAVKMVDDIVNRNKAPELVDRSAGLPKTLPLYPKNYDWEEDKRVLKALDKLYQDTTVELWEELIRRADDPSYCITLMNFAEKPRKESCGFACRCLAGDRLAEVYERHLPRLDGDKGPKTISVDDGVGFDIAEWRKKRADKSLWQLQIEVCENVILNLQKSDYVSQKEKDLARKKIEGEIKKLRKTKEPILPKCRFFHDPEFMYTPERAEKIRKALSSGFTGRLRFVK